MEDEWAHGILLMRDGWPNDRWAVTFAPKDYARPEELLFRDWPLRETLRLAQFIAEIECSRHGHVICPHAESGCCDGYKCFECESPFSRDEHQRLMREQNGRECRCADLVE